MTLPLTQDGAAQRPSIAGQIAEVRRELALRRNVYPKFVREGRMKQAEAELCMVRLEAALSTLQWVAENRDAILQVHRAQGATAA